MTIEQLAKEKNKIKALKYLLKDTTDSKWD